MVFKEKQRILTLWNARATCKRITSVSH